MGIFSRKSRNFVRQPGLTNQPPCVRGTAEFKFDADERPAVSLQKVEESAVNLSRRPASGVSLVKGFNSAFNALKDAKLPGIRMQVIVLVDGSGSMANDYRRPTPDQLSPVEKLVVRTLGFALAVDNDGKIPVFVYGSRVNRQVDIGLHNYERANDLLQPDFGLTCMDEALGKAVDIAIASRELTLIINVTDGRPQGKPNSDTLTKNEFIRSAGYPIMVKNLAIRSVPFLEEVDVMPSKYETLKDADGNPIKDANGRLIIEIDESAVRLLDNVDSKEIDPYKMTDAEFAKALADEISDCLEVMARVGVLTNVPGFVPEYELAQ